jgi:transposase
VSPGNTADIRMAPALLAAAGRYTRLIADRGYDADFLRRLVAETGGDAVIPGRRNRIRAIPYNREAYRQRWRIEAAFCRLKDFRRVATRYDKLATNYLSSVTIAAITAFWI